MFVFEQIVSGWNSLLKEKLGKNLICTLCEHPIIEFVFICANCVEVKLCKNCARITHMDHVLFGTSLDDEEIRGVARSFGRGHPCENFQKTFISLENFQALRV